MKSLLEECSAAFRETGEYSILDTYRSRHSMLTMDDRLAIFKSVNIIFKPVFDQIKSDAPSLSETDLVFCALSVQGFETVAIAECLAVSKEAVRIRKFRMREKMSANLFALLFGETKRYTSETVTLQTNANPDVPIPLSHEPLKKNKGYGKKSKEKNVVRQGCWRLHEQVVYIRGARTSFRVLVFLPVRLYFGLLVESGRNGV